MTKRWAAGFLTRGLVMSGVWFLLTGGAPGSAPAGTLVVLAATAVTLRMEPPGRWRVRAWGTARFVPYFLRHSLRGGLDVALRAFHPRLPLRPRLDTYRLRLPQGAARSFFVGVVSLLPGTLSTRVAGDELLVHVIGGGDAAARLGELEERVGGVFGERLSGSGGR